MVRQSLTEVAEPADGFVDLVMATLPDAGSGVVAGAEPWTALDLVNPVLAGLTALVAVLLVGKPIVAPGAAAIGAAIAAGATLWWNKTVGQWDSRAVGQGTAYRAPRYFPTVSATVVTA